MNKITTSDIEQPEYNTESKMFLCDSRIQQEFIDHVNKLDIQVHNIREVVDNHPVIIIQLEPQSEITDKEGINAAATFNNK